MLDPLLHNETVTVIRTAETGLDDYNMPIVDEQRHDITGVNVQPISRATTETSGNSDLVTGRWLCSGPVDMDVAADDELEWRGERYTVEGYPQRFRTAHGIADHTELWLARAQG